MTRHWTETFDWQNAWYLLRDGMGNQLGPFHGRQATFDQINSFVQAFGSLPDIIEASHQLHVASVWPDGRLMLCDLHDDEGDRLPYRISW